MTTPSQIQHQRLAAEAAAESLGLPPTSFATPQVLVVPDALSAHAKYQADKTALVCGNRRVTWSAFSKRINRVANALLHLGLQKGDKVSVLIPNSIEVCEVICGVVKAGGVVVPLSAQLPGPALTPQINDSDSRILFVGAPLDQVVVPHQSLLIGVSDHGFIGVGFEGDGWRPYEDLLDRASDAEPSILLAYDDDFSIMYSSGTTGVPKGIVHTHFARRDFTLALALGFGITSATVGIVTTPLYSNGTWTVWLTTLFAGGTVVIMPKFDPRQFLELVQREQGTHAFMVPTQYIVTMALPDFERYDLSSLQVLISMGSPLVRDTKEQIPQRFGCDLIELYGLTEGPGTTLAPEVLRQKIDSVGVPGGGGDFRIIDNDGRELPRGEIGEIVGYSTTMMRGYHRQPQKTAEVIWRDERGRLYIRTGDIGKMDADGYLYILDRKKDMIISGGQNVYPVDIEAVVSKHPDVKKVAVIGIPHEKWGETPIALVVRQSDSRVGANEIREWVNPQLGTYQRLSAVEFRETLPRNQLGKLLKRELREPYWPAVST